MLLNFFLFLVFICTFVLSFLSQVSHDKGGKIKCKITHYKSYSHCLSFLLSPKVLLKTFYPTFSFLEVILFCWIWNKNRPSILQPFPFLSFPFFIPYEMYPVSHSVICGSIQFLSFLSTWFLKTTGWKEREGSERMNREYSILVLSIALSLSFDSCPRWWMHKRWIKEREGKWEQKDIN